MGHLAGNKAYRDPQQRSDSMPVEVLLRTIGRLPPAKAAMANRQLQSRFVSAMTGAFKKGVQETRFVEAEA